jgi:hypothetical protein
MCDKCAEKWVFGHKCSSTVQLQAIQESWDFKVDEDSKSYASAPSSPVTTDNQLCVMLSEAALLSIESARSMKLCGSILGHQLVILLDSGSSHCFLDAKVATQLQGLSMLPKPLIVQVANGAHLTFDT